MTSCVCIVGGGCGETGGKVLDVMRIGRVILYIVTTGCVLLKDGEVDFN